MSHRKKSFQAAFFICVGITFIVSGCANQIMQGYVGGSMLRVVEDYGMPTAAYDSDVPGERAFIWVLRSSRVTPGVVNTTANYSSSNLFATTLVAPPYVSTNSCNYTLYGKKTRENVSGPAAWTITRFKEAPLRCQ